MYDIDLGDAKSAEFRLALNRDPARALYPVVPKASRRARIQGAVPLLDKVWPISSQAWPQKGHSMIS